MRALVRFLGSVGWLAALYLALLYLAVGALGVSEIYARFGDRAATIFHTVSVADGVHAHAEEDLRRHYARETEIEQALDDATRALRLKGIRSGLSLQQIQPVIDRTDYAPRLAELRGQAVEVADEEEWSKDMAQVMALQVDLNRLREEVSKHYELLQQDWTSVVHVQTGEAALSASEIEVAASTAATLRRLGYSILFALPREILTLVLALSMGALGSALHVTKVVLDGNEANPPSWYVVRPFQGMIAALIVFILLKAGQLTVSSANGTLNTFVVAFAGISSGLLSFRAHAMIEKAAAGIVGGDDSEANWAVGLKEAMADTGLQVETLAAGVGVAPAEVQAWMDERRQVPPGLQPLVAAWLRRPRRRLFTNLPPEVQEPAGDAGAADPPDPPAPVPSALQQTESDQFVLQ